MMLSNKLSPRILLKNAATAGLIGLTASALISMGCELSPGGDDASTSSSVSSGTGTGTDTGTDTGTEVVRTVLAAGVYPGVAGAEGLDAAGLTDFTGQTDGDTLVCAGGSTDALLLNLNTAATLLTLPDVDQANGCLIVNDSEGNGCVTAFGGPASGAFGFEISCQLNGAFETPQTAHSVVGVYDVFRILGIDGVGPDVFCRVVSTEDYIECLGHSGAAGATGFTVDTSSGVTRARYLGCDVSDSENMAAAQNNGDSVLIQTFGGLACYGSLNAAGGNLVEAFDLGESARDLACAYDANGNHSGVCGVTLPSSSSLRVVTWTGPGDTPTSQSSYPIGPNPVYVSANQIGQEAWIFTTGYTDNTVHLTKTNLLGQQTESLVASVPGCTGPGKAVLIADGGIVDDETNVAVSCNGNDATVLVKLVSFSPFVPPAS